MEKSINGASSPLFLDVFIDAANEKNSVQLFEFRDESVDDLLRIIRPYCNDKDKSPIVCVDYLQIIPPSDDVKLSTDKTRIDGIVHKLKTFQRETNTTFIIISSFNRVNYFQQVSFESFKESGNIEYTADVVWALQLYIANIIKDGANISSTRKKFEDAKKTARTKKVKMMKLASPFPKPNSANWILHLGFKGVILMIFDNLSVKDLDAYLKDLKAYRAQTKADFEAAQRAYFNSLGSTASIDIKEELHKKSDLLASKLDKMDDAIYQIQFSRWTAPTLRKLHLQTF